MHYKVSVVADISIIIFSEYAIKIIVCCMKCIIFQNAWDLKDFREPLDYDGYIEVRNNAGLDKFIAVGESYMHIY